MRLSFHQYLNPLGCRLKQQGAQPSRGFEIRAIRYPVNNLINDEVNWVAGMGMLEKTSLGQQSCFPP
jgi:hypothetical protein